jgi:hypothetical protein
LVRGGRQERDGGRDGIEDDAGLRSARIPRAIGGAHQNRIGTLVEREVRLLRVTRYGIESRPGCNQHAIDEELDLHDLPVVDDLRIEAHGMVHIGR